MAGIKMSAQDLRSQEFKVTIGRTLEGIEYPVHASSPAGSATGVFVLPFSVDQIEQALQNFQQGIPGGRYRRMRKKREVQFDKLSPEGFGSALFRALFSDKVLTIYRKSLSMAGKPGVANRIPVKLNIMAWQLASLPWELLYDTEKGEFLGFGQDTPVIRVVDREPSLPTFDPPLRVLLVSANPADTELSDLEHERKVIEEALSTLKREDKVKIDYLFGATIRALRSKVREYEPHVIHFMGHGQVNHLLLEDRARAGASLTASSLGIILRNAFSLRMVVFNACETARPPDDPGRGLGLAHGLARRKVPATIAMQFGISDEAAQEFVRELYQALAKGQPIDEAVLRGRIRIQNRFTDGMEWATPVLYMQAREGQIFNDLLPMEGKEELTYPAPEKRPKVPVAEKESLEPSLQARVHTYYEQGRRHFNESKWDLALFFLDDVQRMAPTYKDVQRLVKMAREELTKQETERRTQEKLAALYRQALIHCKEKRWQAAVDLFNEILDIDPNYKDVKAQAETARRAHAQQLAEGQIHSSLTTLYQRAQEHLAAEDWERAVELFEQVIHIDQDYADAPAQLIKAQRGKSLAELYHKAEEAFDAQNWEQAIANLGEAIAIDKSSKDVAAKLEQARQQQRWDALYQAGLEYLEIERWDAAVEALREVQPDQKRRKDVEVARLYAEGRQYAAQEKWEPALARLEEVVEENPQYRNAARQLQEVRRQKRLHDFYTAGLEQAKAQEWRQAIHAFEQVAREAPNYPGVQSQLTLVRGEVELAERYASGKRFSDLGRWSEAVQEFQSIVKVRPDYPNAQRMLEKAIQEQKLADLYAEGALCLAQGKWQETIDVLERLVGIAPNYRDAASQLDDARKKKLLSSAYEQGKACYEQENWAEAIRYLKQVMAYEEEGYRDAKVLLAEAKGQKQLARFYQKGIDYLSMGNWDKAISSLKQVIKLDQTYRDAGAQLAEAQLQKRLADFYTEAEKLMEIERWEDAVTIFRQILEKAPNYRDVPALLAEAQRRHRLVMLYTAADQAYEEGHWTEAIEKFQQILVEAKHRGIEKKLAEAHRQQELEERYEQGMAYFGRGDWKGVITALGAVIEKELDYKDAFVKLREARRRQTLASHYVEGEQHMAGERWDEAITTFDKIMGIDPRYRDVKKRLDEANRRKRLAELHARGLRFHEAEKWSEALEVWSELAALEPSYPDVAAKVKEVEQQKTLEDTYAVGVASLATGAWEQAVTTFEKIIGIDADYRDARGLLRKAEQGRWDDWESRMLSSLQDSGKLTANSLNYVPKRLRLDTMRRFYEEYSTSLELALSTDFQALTLLNFDLVSNFRKTWRAMQRATQSEQTGVAESKPAFWTQLKRIGPSGWEPAKSLDILAGELTDQLCSALDFVTAPGLDRDRQHKQLYARMIRTPTLHYKLPPLFPLIILAKQFVEAEDIQDLLDLMHILEHMIGLAFLVTLGDADQLKTLLNQEGVEHDFVVINRHDLEQILLSRDKAAQLTQTIVGQVSLTVISPYRVAGPVPERMFFGREKEIRTIRDNIRDANVALTGGRRIGKTSILRKVQRILATQLDFKTFHLDCHAVDTHEIFFREFTGKLGDRIESPQTFRQAIETARTEEDKLIVVLLDEVCNLLQHDVEQQGEKLFKELRSLSQEGYCNFIFCGGKPLYKRIHNPDSPFFNFCHNVVLRFLNEESATGIIIHPMNGMGIELRDQDELVAQILKVSSCHPNIVQLICKKLIENIKGRTISLDDLHKVITREDFYRDFKEIAWGQATSLERIVSLAFVEEEGFTKSAAYQRLAKFGIEDREAIDDALDTLDLYSLITKRGKRYEYALREFPRIARETEDIKTLIDSFARQLDKEA
jgi:tetratricopeptide (TPR) repeat protein